MLQGKEYKAVFSDIDGTLLNTSHQIPEKTREKIMDMRRPWGFRLFWYLPELPKGMTAIRDELGSRSPMICYSGALVVDEDGKPIYSVALKDGEAREICEVIPEITPDVSVNVYSNDRWMAEDLKEYWVDQEMKITGVRAEEVSFQDEEVMRGSSQNIVHGTGRQHYGSGKETAGKISGYSYL